MAIRTSCGGTPHFGDPRKVEAQEHPHMDCRATGSRLGSGFGRRPTRCSQLLCIRQSLCSILRKSSFMNEDTIFKAIAHPARREILALLAADTRSVKELTATFAMSQPAVSQHLRELRNAKLVTSEKVGLEQRYRLTGRPLRVVFDWSSRYQQFFDPSGHVWRLAGTELPPKIKGERARGR